MDLNRTLATQESILARVLGEDISLKMRLDPKLWSITFDPAAFEQVLLNLTMNARDAIPGSGSVRVETDNFVVEEPSSFGAGPQLSPGNYVRLTILDDGEGIDPAILDRVFDPFFTTKPGGRGTGLGLATCYGLIRQANGFIDVQSSPGTGTIVEVLLPASSAPTQTATPERATGGRRGSETVLVVEDDDQVRKVAIMVLRARGYDVLEAADGTHALQICSERGNQIDALLTDVIMPGMSGRVLVEQIGQHWQHIRVLFMSGYTADAIIPRGGAGEGIALLSKPFTPASLTKKLREVLDSEEYRADIVAERLTSS